jgi:hypothetical protein
MIIKTIDWRFWLDSFAPGYKPMGLSYDQGNEASIFITDMKFIDLLNEYLLSKNWLC